MRKISTIVIAVHFAILLVMAWMSSHVVEHKKARLVVHTVTPAPKVTQKRQTPIAAAKPTPAPIAPPAPVQAAAKPAPAPQKPIQPAPVQAAAKPAPASQEPTKPVAQKKGLQASTPKKTAPAPKPKAKEPNGPPAEAVELLKQLEQSLAKIEEPQTAAAPSAPARKRSNFSVPTLKIDHADDEIGDVGYEGQLISYLYNTLSLPEFGDVKMKLTLQNNGICVKIQVIRAQSAKNRRYLEEQLPKLRLPPFTGMLASKKEQTFVVTFCNE